jgi:hypothetical protein
MIRNENGARFSEFKKWEDTKNQPYDYKENGLVNHILSHKIHKTKNPILKFILQYYEKSLVYCMKYVDILNNYKNYMKYNR